MNPSLSENRIRKIDSYGCLESYEINMGRHRAVISRFGGQLLAWEFAERSVLFENKQADLSMKSPYRGGAPICFPIFGDGKFIDGEKHEPSHGRARVTVWSAPVLVDESSVELKCEIESVTGIPLELIVRYRFLDRSLQTEFNVRNTGLSPTPIQLAFHSYFDGEPVALRGIGGRYIDANDGFKNKQGGLPPDWIVNRIYLEPEPAIDLEMKGYSLKITSHNLPNVVVWNPGPDHLFNDLGDPRFLCVESAVIEKPETLDPHAEWNAWVRYDLR